MVENRLGLLYLRFAPVRKLGLLSLAYCCPPLRKLGLVFFVYGSPAYHQQQNFCNTKKNPPRNQFRKNYKKKNQPPLKETKNTTHGSYKNKIGGRNESP